MKSIFKYFKRIVCVFSVIVLFAFIVRTPMETANADVTEIPNINELIEELAVLVNEERANNGLEPMYLVPYLNEIAEIRAEEIIGSFVHARPDGEKWQTVIDEDIVPYRIPAELIAGGSSTAEGTFNQILNSEQHYQIMLKEQLTHMGIGVAYDPDSTYKWYWTLIFVSLDTDWCDYLGWKKDDNGVTILEGQYSVYKAESNMSGDINGDGIIDSFDLVLLRKYLLQEITFTTVQREAADVAYDGAVTYMDAAYLKKYIFGEIEELPLRLF